MAHPPYLSARVTIDWMVRELNEAYSDLDWKIVMDGDRYDGFWKIGALIGPTMSVIAIMEEGLNDIEVKPGGSAGCEYFKIRGPVNDVVKLVREILEDWEILGRSYIEAGSSFPKSEEDPV